MKKWQQYVNYRKIKGEDGAEIFIITVDGVDVAVSEEIYREYAATARKMKYMELDLKRDRFLQGAFGKTVKDDNGQSVALPEREVSLDKLLDEDWDYPSCEPSPEGIFMGRADLDTLNQSLDELKPEERELISALFFKGMTEREYSKQTGIPQKTINDRKNRILRKLRNFLKIN